MTPALTSREIFDESQKLLGQLLRCDFGIQFLDDALLGMAPGELTLVGARSGGGKTEFAVQLLLEQQAFEKKNCKSVLYFALDHNKAEIETRVLWRKIMEQIRMTEDPRFHGIHWRFADWAAGRYDAMLKDFESDGRIFNKHLFALSETDFLYRKGKLTAQDVADTIADTSNSQRYNLFIIDHFHALLGVDKLEDQSRAINAIAEAAERAERPVVLLGQFRKRNQAGPKNAIPDMEEFSGSSQLLYVPQNIVVIAPVDEEDLVIPGKTNAHYATYFHVEKSRTAADSKKFVGIHVFDMESKEYSTRYFLMEHSLFGKPKVIPRDKFPQWARGAMEAPFIENETVKEKPKKAYGKAYKDD